MTNEEREVALSAILKLVELTRYVELSRTSPDSYKADVHYGLVRDLNAIGRKLVAIDDANA